MRYTLSKAKYLRRVPTGNPSRPYRYIYREDAARTPLPESTEILRRTRRVHGAGLEAFTSKLRELAPGATVMARVKTAASIKGKLKAKPKYRNAGDLQDVTGARLVHKTNAQVLATVAKIKAEYHVVTHDDYITSPQKTGYMSYHLIVRDHDGLEKEIQVRTEAQNAMADWHHDIYKPRTKDQRAAQEKHAEAANTYAKALWQWHEKRDNGKPAGPRPVVPHPEIARVFGAGP